MGAISRVPPRSTTIRFDSIPKRQVEDVTSGLGSPPPNIRPTGGLPRAGRSTTVRWWRASGVTRSTTLKGSPSGWAAGPRPPFARCRSASTGSPKGSESAAGDLRQRVGAPSEVRSATRHRPCGSFIARPHAERVVVRIVSVVQSVLDMRPSCRRLIQNAAKPSIYAAVEVEVAVVAAVVPAVAVGVAARSPGSFVESPQGPERLRSGPG